MLILDSAEEGLEYIDIMETADKASVTLLVSKKFTINGEPDEHGQGMCLLHDKMLSLGFSPDGMLDKPFFKMYRYKQLI